MEKRVVDAQVGLVSLEECEYEYVAPELARLYATQGNDQLDGIYQGDSVQLTVVGNNCQLVLDSNI